MADSKDAVIVTVPADWTPEIAIGLSEEGYQTWNEHMFSGQRVLIYKTAPVDAVVAEGEVHDQITQRLDDWPAINVRQRPLTGLGTRADYVLPLRILYSRAEQNQVPLAEIKKWVTDPDFPGLEWKPIDRDAYQALTNWP